MIKLNSERFESAFENPTSKKRVSNSIPLGSGIGLYLSQAIQSPLLSKSEEQILAQKISRYRTAFQRLILQEPAVVEHLVDLLTKWENKKLRLDSVCNVALSETAKRKTLEPKIRKSLKTLRRAAKQLAAASMSNKRSVIRKVIRLVEPLMIRPRPFETAPFENPKAILLLCKYNKLCQQMTQSNMRLVVQVARKLCGGSPVLMDMIQEGNRGLMHAVTKFDHCRAIRFSTYATPWIKQAIYAALPNSQRNIRVPDNFRTKGRAIQRRMYELMDGENWPQFDSNSDRVINTIAEEMDLCPIEVANVITIQRDTCSLDQPIQGRNSSSTLGGMIADTRDNCPHWLANVRERQQLVRATMKRSLNDREREVISLRFGIGDGKNRSFAEVGREMGITRERVRQLEKQAIEKLGQLESLLRVAAG
ncbi:MAG: RNA polymerase sigma factor RpoD/SigA [Mariniblastus sp.]